ncbi:MAG TPA: S41 family peptidase [Xanthomonadaceae bacterium]|nr:S41 family peptidase [Xanthomonadaceae bacterium]
MRILLLALFLPTLSVAAPPAQPLPIEQIRQFTSVFNTVERGYVDELDRERLMQAAIRGLLQELDPHSEYLDEREVAELAEETQGAYAGIGMEVQLREDGRIEVVAPIDDTPAARAGVLAGDILRAIDGEPVAPGTPLREVVSALRGRAGTRVGLTLEREGHGATLMMQLRRERIRVVSVRSELLPSGHGYLRISNFQTDTARDVRRQLQRMQQRAGAPLAGLVVDLRSNPGGLVNAAVEVADLLVDKGLLVSIRGRLPDTRLSFDATPGDLLDGAPVAVLVDGGTASAAEILAAALQDLGRARVVGLPTFGKGSVQTLLPLDNGHAIKLTTARYYTPNGRAIEKGGLKPDLRLTRVPPPGRGSLTEDEAVQATLALLQQFATAR